MPMYPCGIDVVTGGLQDSKTAAKKIEMHAEMMKANPASMEKYANQW